MPDPPSGRVTLVFTDIEGPTRLLHALGPAAAVLVGVVYAEHELIPADEPPS